MIRFWLLTRDGKELFYRLGTKLISVPVHLTVSAVAESPRLYSTFRRGVRFYVSRDGQRFLIALRVEEGPPGRLTIDTDWRAGLSN